MKEVIKISIAGIAFSLDGDAYGIIDEYIDRLKEGFGNNPDGREIVADIEARIAELILTAQPADRVVERELAEQIVSQLGYPDDMEKEQEPRNRLHRRLYRNPDGQKMGGVCNGLGSYFGVDPTMVRLGMFVPLVLYILFGFMFRNDGPSELMGNLFMCLVLLYIVMWIVIPVARTPREKLEMKGEKVTAHKIKASMVEGANTPTEEKNASVWSEIFCVMGRIVLFFMKLFLFFIATMIGLVAMGILIAFFAVLLGGFVGLGWELLAGANFNLVTPNVYVALGLASLLLLLVVVIYVLIRILSKRKSSNTPLVVLMILWLLTTVAFGVVTLSNWRALTDDNLWENIESSWWDYDVDITTDSNHNDDYDSFEETMESLGEWEDDSSRNTLSVSATVVETKDSQSDVSNNDAETSDSNSSDSSDNNEDDGRKSLHIDITTE